MGSKRAASSPSNVLPLARRPGPRCPFCYENPLLGRLRERDLVAQTLKTTHEIPCRPSLLKPVQVGAAEVVVRPTCGQHVVCGDEDLVADRHRGPLRAPAGSKSVKLVAQVATLLVGSGHRGLHKGRSQVDVAASGRTALL